ncbi:energy transducer TonB [Pseudoduganella umbonata]|uniref:Energy transducer TonB n=1 Tax=Pseudoduganella umbonata TaxID=864828 RepID=A0A4P8HKB8_9BURK|nr:energy transducer TonB [Pseudoduganella umbonata]MBB3220020.1 protein TonB [Pseudoduganella umbonata]QCP10027.1 energy transducer TonB [Pseudoduganella umbonata]
MSTATLSLQENARVPRPVPPPLTGGALAGVSAGTDGGWLRGRGVAGSAAVHGAVLLAVLALSGGPADTPAPAPVVELIRLQPEVLKPPPPPPEPEREPEQPKQLTAARPVPAPVPVPKTVAVAAEAAETYTPPPAPQQAASIGPVAPPAPSPVAQAPATPEPPPPAAPKQIATEGIPTDYVNQVYARINGSTEYPREAKMRRQQGKVGYRLTLSPQGALLGVEIQTSGNDVLDEAAREAIGRAAPFPKLPDLGGSSYLLAGNIFFRIN